MIIIIKLHFLLSCILFVAVVLVWVIFVVCSFCFKKVWIAPAGKKRQTQSNHDIYCSFPFYSWVWKKKSSAQLFLEQLTERSPLHWLLLSWTIRKNRQIICKVNCILMEKVTVNFSLWSLLLVPTGNSHNILRWKSNFQFHNNTITLQDVNTFFTNEVLAPCWEALLMAGSWKINKSRLFWEIIHHSSRYR